MILKDVAQQLRGSQSAAFELARHGIEEDWQACPKGLVELANRAERASASIRGRIPTRALCGGRCVEHQEAVIPFPHEPGYCPRLPTSGQLVGEDLKRLSAVQRWVGGFVSHGLDDVRPIHHHRSTRGDPGLA